VGVFMKKKNGFISISIIYSFFVIFLLMLVLIMSSYVNTRLRLNIYKKDIKRTYAVKEQSLFSKISGLGTSTIYKIVDGSKTLSYRYIGGDPNNYISFNNESWRIVGAICKNNNCASAGDYVIKIVRNATISSAWDCKKSGVGTSSSNNGSHNWKDSQLMMLLNSPKVYISGYTLDKYSVRDKKNIVIYPYMGAYLNNDIPLYKIVATDTNGFTSTAAITKCTGASSSNCLRIIDSISLNKIEDFSHNIYAFKFEDISSTNTIDKLEKGGTVGWSGKVGLLYASDICFAYKNNTNRNNCLKNASLADNDSWLKIANEEWLLDATSDKYVLYKGATFLKSNNMCAAKIIRPVVYLKSTTKIVGNNNGSISQPFIIGD
jgi:hypothetical protein